MTKESSTARVVIAGDIYPGYRSSLPLIQGDARGVFGDLLENFQDADLLVGNLEGPFTERPTPIGKIGPSHTIHPGCANGLGSAGFDLLNLANNHTMDHGPEGLRTTLETAAAHGLACVGAGDNCEVAARPWIREVAGLRIGILSFTEHEFGVARTSRAGTNGLDARRFVRSMRAFADSWDFLIVLLHAGAEYFPYPRPDLQDFCRFLVELGAGAVVCQHSHCVGCAERYLGSWIVYGQGNLLFDDRSTRSCEQEGALLQLRVTSGVGSELQWIPFSQVDDAPGPVRMSPSAASAFHDEVGKRSANLLRTGYIDDAWRDFCRQSSYNFIALLQGYPQRIRELDLKFRFLPRIRTRQRLEMLLHLLRCESHREACLSALEQELRERGRTVY